MNVYIPPTLHSECKTSDEQHHLLQLQFAEAGTTLGESKVKPSARNLIPGHQTSVPGEKNRIKSETIRKKPDPRSSN